MNTKARKINNFFKKNSVLSGADFFARKISNHSRGGGQKITPPRPAAFARFCAPVKHLLAPKPWKY